MDNSKAWTSQVQEINYFFKNIIFYYLNRQFSNCLLNKSSYCLVSKLFYIKYKSFLNHGFDSCFKIATKAKKLF